MPLVMLRLLEATVANIAFPEDHDYDYRRSGRESIPHGAEGTE